MNTKSTDLSQLSVAVTLVGAVGTALQSTVASTGVAEIVGAFVSFTVIICVLASLLPQSSLAVHVRSIV